MLTDAIGAFAELGIFDTRRCDAGEVALDIGRENWHAAGSKLLCEHLKRAGLACAGGAGNQAVPVEHRDRNPHLHPRLGVTVDKCPDFEDGSAEIVAGADHLDGVGIEGASW